MNESWVYAAEYKPNETVSFNLTVENRAEEIVEVFVLIAIRGNTTADDMEQIVVQGGAPGAMTFTLADFDRVDFNPFYLNIVSAGSHGVYPPSSNATWVTYPVGLLDGVGSGNNVSTLLVEVALGPDPSEIFVVHSDGYALDSNGQLKYWSPNGHDTTLVQEEEKGNGRGKKPKKKDDGNGNQGGGHGKKAKKKDEGDGQTPSEDPLIPGVIQDDPPTGEDPTVDPPLEEPTEGEDPPVSEQENPEGAVGQTETSLPENDVSLEELNDVSETEADTGTDCTIILAASAMIALIVSILLLAFARRRR